MSVVEPQDDVGRVRIPAELYASFNQFFTALKCRVLETAVQRASSRIGNDDFVVLQMEELVSTIREALPEIAAELKNEFSLHEREHVRRAS